MTATTPETDDFTFALLLRTSREAGSLAGAMGTIIAIADSYLAVYTGDQPHHPEALRAGLAEVSEYARKMLAGYEAGQAGLSHDTVTDTTGER